MFSPSRDREMVTVSFILCTQERIGDQQLILHYSSHFHSHSHKDSVTNPALFILHAHTGTISIIQLCGDIIRDVVNCITQSKHMQTL